MSRHLMVQVIIYDVGMSTRYESVHDLSAAEAFAARVRRLKDHGVPHGVDGLTVSIRRERGQTPDLVHTEFLEYRDMQP